jgi:ATP-binding cassette subfamily F protein uup
LLIARLMLRPANVLVLDEPTNDLDLATLGVLEEALTSFPGAVLLVTHDRYFLDQVATQILAFHTKPGEEGQVTAFADVAQWQPWHREQMAASRSARAASAPRARAEAGAPASKKKLSFKDQRDWDTIEGRITEAEARRTALEEEAGRPEVAVDAARLVALQAELTAAQLEIDALYARWAELEALQAG